MIDTFITLILIGFSIELLLFSVASARMAVLVFIYDRPTLLAKIRERRNHNQKRP